MPHYAGPDTRGWPDGANYAPENVAMLSNDHASAYISP